MTRPDPGNLPVGFQPDSLDDAKVIIANLLEQLNDLGITPKAV